MICEVAVNACGMIGKKDPPAVNAQIEATRPPMQSDIDDRRKHRETLPLERAARATMGLGLGSMLVSP